MKEESALIALLLMLAAAVVGCTMYVWRLSDQLIAKLSRLAGRK